MNIHREALLFSFLSGALVAQNQVPLLTDTDWLSSHLKDPNLVVLHVGRKDNYDKGHIPGARLINMSDIASPMGKMDKPELMLELPPASELRKKFASLGISDNSRIVAYLGDGEMLPAATRVLFTLDYLGLGDQVSLLNGGQSEWARSGHSVTAAMPDYAQGKLTDRPLKKVVADANLVKSAAQSSTLKLVDARAPVFFNGAEASFAKKGHIPGAVNIPFNLVPEDSSKIDPNHLRKLFDTAGIKPGDTVIAYCHIGAQATAVVFAARILGYPVMLYDGSFQDWVLNDRGPLVGDPAVGSAGAK